MSKKHFIEVAKMINNLGNRTQAEFTALWFADFFAKYHKLFDRERFLTACGVEQYKPKKITATDLINIKLGLLPEELPE